MVEVCIATRNGKAGILPPMRSNHDNAWRTASDTANLELAETSSFPGSTLFEPPRMGAIIAAVSRVRLHRTEAIVLKRHDYGEADRFIVLFTKEKGNMGAGGETFDETFVERGQALYEDLGYERETRFYKYSLAL